MRKPLKTSETAKRSPAKTTSFDFGTFDIARLCRVSPGTVANWIDSGKIPSYQTVGGHRRVRREDLIIFFNFYQFPLPPELGSEGPLRALIVDDDKLDRERMARLIRKIRPEAVIEETDEGFVAGQKISGDRPKLVILDVVLPGIDGFRVCESIRSDARLAGVRILGISGHSDESDLKRRFLRKGGDDFLPKDAEDGEFLARIERLAGRTVDR